MSALVYKITNECNNKIYFGYTTQPLKARFRDHCKCSDNGYLQNSIKKYGKDKFIIEQLYDFGSELEAKTTEIYLIAKFQTNICKYRDGNGMNMTDGGDGIIGLKHTSESKQKISESRLALKFKHSEKTKQKYSEARSGKLNGMFGRTHSKETIELMRFNRGDLSGKNNPMYGRKQSEETKEKIRQKALERNRIKEGNL